MPPANLSEDRVAERLGALEDGYASFPVNQTTLSVAAGAYERVRERCQRGLAEVYVEIYNERGQVLLLEDDNDGWVLPRAEPCRSDRLVPATRRAVTGDTGLECRLTGLERATIVGVRDEEDPDRDPIYRLVALFTAERTGGRPAAAAVWRSEIPQSALPRY